MTVSADSFNSIKKSTEPALYNSRIFNNYIEYIKNHHPDIDTDLLLKKADISIYEFSDAAHWFTQSQVNRFHEVMTKEINDPFLARKVGRFSTTSIASGTVRKYGLGFITPSSVYWAFEKQQKC